jgi:hypothetical protein
MRLDELTFPQKLGDATRILTDAGYWLIGTGSFGSVFYKDGQKSVLKLFKTSDRAYRAFVDMARQHQDNPYFPKFSRNAVRINDEYSAVRTELLRVAYDTNFIKFVSSYITFSEGRKPDDIDEADTLNMAIDWLKTQPASLTEACKILQQVIRDHDFHLDLHDKNIMKRGTQIVFIDPLWLGYS